MGQDLVMRITYEGPPSLAGAVASMLEREGVSVGYDPPMEERGAGEVAYAVVHYVVTNAGDVAFDVVVTAAVLKAKAKLHERFKVPPDVRLEVEDDDD
jgi:hypothetical protein